MAPANWLARAHHPGTPTPPFVSIGCVRDADVPQPLISQECGKQARDGGSRGVNLKTL